MFAFLCTFLPRSVNAKKKPEYYNELALAFQHYHAEVAPQESDLYGCAYYFHKVRTDLDADNLSKPIWDALRKVAFIDDKQIKFRTSGVFDLRANQITVLDLTRMPEYLLEDFLKFIDDSEKAHIVYIEFGNYHHGLFRFGLG